MVVCRLPLYYKSIFLGLTKILSNIKHSLEAPESSLLMPIHTVTTANLCSTVEENQV